MPELDNLPYTENGRALPKTVQIGLVLVSMMLVGLRFYGFIPLHYWRCLTPALFVLVVRVLYHVIRNATHEAIRLADADAALDAHVLEHIGKAAKRTLTPSVLAAKVEGALS